MIDKQKVRFILNKKSVITIIVIFLLVFILIVFLDVNLNPYPPKIIFVDEETNTFLDGMVLLDDKHIGDTLQGEFKKLPDDFCKKKHKITLDLSGKEYSWESFPSDCQLNYIIFKVEREKLWEKKNVTMRFFIKETQEPIKGRLYFDNEVVGDIDGDYVLSTDVCSRVRVINIKTETSEMEWKHHSVWCENYDVIDYSISEEELE